MKPQQLQIIIIAIIVIAIIYIIKRGLKVPKINALALITGGVKSGKSTLAVRIAIKKYKQNKRGVTIRNFIRKYLFRMKPEEMEEIPLLYSNIPIGRKGKDLYTPLTEDILTRATRPRYKSVIYIGEASLVSNSMNYKNEELNEKQLLFYKLIAHETKGGCVIIDTQCIQDCHYSIKRSISEYIYIHHTIKVPFFIICYVKEYRYSEDNSVIGTENEDIEDTLKKVVIPKSTWKYFDCYCYSSMTDNLKVDDKEIKVKEHKAERIISFNKFKNLYGRQEGKK